MSQTMSAHAALRTGLSALILAHHHVVGSQQLFDQEYYKSSVEAVPLCMTGRQQSPVNIDTSAAQGRPVPSDMYTDIVFPTVQNPVLRNTGHALEVCLPLPAHLPVQLSAHLSVTNSVRLDSFLEREEAICQMHLYAADVRVWLQV